MGDSVAFVKQVMEALDAEGPTDLAKKLGMTSFATPKRISRWLDGESAPNWEATMLMLEKAGMLRYSPAPPVSARAVVELDDELGAVAEEIADGLERLLHLVSERTRPQAVGGQQQ